MPLFLDINGTKFEGKCNFLFDQVSTVNFGTDEVKENPKTGEQVKTGKKVKGSGIQNILSGLLEYNTVSIVDFWECALAGYRENMPKREEIEAALMTRIETDSDTLPLIKETFQTINESGFFKQDVKKFLKNFSLMDRLQPKDEEEKLQQELAKEMVEDALKELGLTMTKSS